jgi:hypothetical protein
MKFSEISASNHEILNSLQTKNKMASEVALSQADAADAEELFNLFNTAFDVEVCLFSVCIVCFALQR